MTTKVTVDAHAGWDVEVVVEDIVPEGTRQETIVVEKHTVRDFYLTSHRKLTSVTELQTH